MHDRNLSKVLSVLSAARSSLDSHCCSSWDFELTYTREFVRQPDVTDAAPANVDPDGASLFTALQEQLGLELEPTRAPVRVLVIDPIEPPSAD